MALIYIMASLGLMDSAVAKEAEEGGRMAVGGGLVSSEMLVVSLKSDGFIVCNRTRCCLLRVKAAGEDDDEEDR